MDPNTVYSEQFRQKVRGLIANQDRSPALRILQRATMDAINQIKNLDHPPEQHRLEGARGGTPDLRDCHKWYVFPVESERPTHRIVYRRLDDGTTEVLNIGLRDGLSAYREMADITGRPVDRDVVDTPEDPSPADRPVQRQMPTKDEVIQFAKDSHDVVKEALTEYVMHTKGQTLQPAADSISRRRGDRQTHSGRDQPGT